MKYLYFPCLLLLIVALCANCEKLVEQVEQPVINNARFIVVEHLADVILLQDRQTKRCYLLNSQGGIIEVEPRIPQSEWPQ